MNSFEELEELVLNWADAKGILQASTAPIQMTKTLEECAEVLRELHATNLDPDALTSEYGDILVTLIVGMRIANVRPTTALHEAYLKISKRFGRMEGGVFVKDGER